MLGGRYRLRFDVQHVERGKRYELDSPGQTFAGLPEQVHGRRSQDQKSSRAAPGASTPVDQAAQLREQSRRPVDFVQHDEAVFVRGQEHGRLRETAPIGARLEVDVQRVHLLGDIEGEGRLADLARADQRHGRLAAQGLANACAGATGNHPCKSKELI